MSQKKRALKRTGLVLAILVLALGWAWFAGYRVRIEKRGGWPTRVAMRFGAGETAPVLVQDFTDPQALPPTIPPGGRARNLVILIGDGLGFGQLLGARIALAGIDGRLAIERLPVTGWVTTHSSGRLLTDSAAGATALSTGEKTFMGRVAADSDGQPSTTLMEAAAARGKAVGLLTDSYLWDATPASFSVHSKTRRDYAGIAAQMAESGFDLLLGEEHVDLDEDDEGGPIVEDFRRRGYHVVHDASGLRSPEADGRPLLGLFRAGTVHLPDRAPELADLTEFALERLARDADGFTLLVETEETDTGSHAHDFDRVVRGMSALDRATRIAVDFARRDRETLVVVTADHDTGGLSLLGGRDGKPLSIRWATGSHTGNPIPLLAYGPGAEELGGVRDNTEVHGILARLLGLELE